jgi:hypothetical protein
MNITDMRVLYGYVKERLYADDEEEGLFWVLGHNFKRFFYYYLAFTPSPSFFFSGEKGENCNRNK